ncbi:MAG: hypothetical protein AAFQ79_14545 [Pseudomonadota bacterium]
MTKAGLRLLATLLALSAPAAAAELHEPIAPRASLGAVTLVLDGDLILAHNEREAFTNHAGTAVDRASSFNETFLLRPSLRFGTIGQGSWAAAKAELGSGNRRRLDHQDYGPASGFAVTAGHNGAWVAVGNGYTNDPLDQDIAQAYLSAFGPSYLDGTYAVGRRSDDLNIEFLDAGYLWSTMVAQIQDDDYARIGLTAPAVGHGTFSAGYRSSFGNLRFLTDSKGVAQEVSFARRFDRGQIQFVAAQVGGIDDRWGNPISDRYYGITGGLSLSPRWTLGARHFTTDSDVRANSGWGDGSNQTIVMTSYEAAPGQHIWGRITRTNRAATNAALTVVENLRQEQLIVGYSGQLSNNLAAGVSVSQSQNSSPERGTSDRFSTVSAFISAKW